MFSKSMQSLSKILVKDELHFLVNLQDKSATVLKMAYFTDIF